MASKPRSKDQADRERELDAWLEHAIGVAKPDIEPVVRDL